VEASTESESSQAEKTQLVLRETVRVKAADMEHGQLGADVTRHGDARLDAIGA